MPPDGCQEEEDDDDDVTFGRRKVTYIVVAAVVAVIGVCLLVASRLRAFWCVKENRRKVNHARS